MKNGQTIDISKKKYSEYKKIKAIMDELVVLDNMSSRMPYDAFAKTADSIVKKNDTTRLSFKEFIADNEDGDSVISINYDEYELLIAAKISVRAIKILDKKSKNKLDWNSYGIAIDSIIEGYNQKEVV